MIRRCTSFDVAEKAGVSQSTVSKALRDGEGVGAETRRRVLEAAAALNYRPDQHAVSLRSGSTGRIAVVILCDPDARGASVNSLCMDLLRKSWRLRPIAIGSCWYPSSTIPAISTPATAGIASRTGSSSSERRGTRPAGGISRGHGPRARTSSAGVARTTPFRRSDATTMPAPQPPFDIWSRRVLSASSSWVRAGVASMRAGIGDPATSAS